MLEWTWVCCLRDLTLYRVPQRAGGCSSNWFLPWDLHALHQNLNQGFLHPCKLMHFQKLLMAIQRWSSSKLSITTIHNFRRNPTKTCSLFLSLEKLVEPEGHKASKTLPCLLTGLRQPSVATGSRAKLNYMAVHSPVLPTVNVVQVIPHPAPYQRDSGGIHPHMPQGKE